VANGQSFRYMFEDSGMNHSIGGRYFRSNENSVGSLDVFVSVG